MRQGNARSKVMSTWISVLSPTIPARKGSTRLPSGSGASATPVPFWRRKTRPDGSVTIRFAASGHLEMAWALYPWGDKVEVIKPEALRLLVQGHQREDFPAVP